jgi:hypothetical protein
MLTVIAGIATTQKLTPFDFRTGSGQTLYHQGRSNAAAPGSAKFHRVRAQRQASGNPRAGAELTVRLQGGRSGGKPLLTQFCRAPTGLTKVREARAARRGAVRHLRFDLAQPK